LFVAPQSENTLKYKKETGTGMFFFMRFNNQTGSTVTERGLNNLLSEQTGNPVLQSAVVERTGGVVNDVKGSGNSINDFTVANNESCVFRITWDDGVFCLQIPFSDSYKNIVRSAGCKISGNYDVPNYFMLSLFDECVNYNQQTGDTFNTSRWRPTSIGDYFLYDTWGNCTSLTTAVVPDTSNWNVTSIGVAFLGSTWYNCTSLTTAVAPDTSNWNVTSIGDYFLNYTWDNCTSLTTAVVPDTSNWNITSIGSDFLNYTWYNCTSLTTAVVPDTSNWNVTSIGIFFLYDTWGNAFATATGSTNNVTLKGSIYTGNIKLLQSNSGSIANARIGNVKVDSNLISTYQNSSSWSNITDSKFISW
jgi:hypothetical protein